MAAITVLAAVMIFLASSGVSQPVRAEGRKLSLFHPSSSAGVVTTLRNYVTKIEYHHPAPSAQGASGGDPFTALKNYARQAGIRVGDPVEQSTPSRQKAIKVAATNNSAAEAHYVGNEACMGCHAAQAAVFEKTLMGRVGKTQPGLMNCENCHGPGSEHVKAGGGRGVGGIISFRPNDFSRTAKQNNAICLTCHDKGHRVLWKGSTHETRNIACTNCHTVMKSVSRKHQLKKTTVIATCAQCHKNKRAQFWRSTHMPVIEGKMTCTSCHNPHGSFGQSLLKEASVNENCYKCHAEKRGPFLFEHAPVRESCLNCHNPHGSNNDFLLKVSRPRLCQQCHSGGYHPSNPRDRFSVYALNRACQHCHSRHHGSNSPAGQRFQR